nr:Snf7 family protein [Candidatus Njordarchaeum guaymaensis]
MSKFSKEWEGTGRTGIKGVLRPQAPLRTRLEFAMRRIDAQSQSIEGTITRLKERDRNLFSKVVDAYSKHDTQRANAYANELAEIRKMANFMMSAKLALERVVLRLSTISQLGSAAVTLAPAVKVLHSIRSGIAGIMPGAEQELGDVARLLDEIMIEAGQTTGTTFDFEAAGEDAQKILNEAAIVAEQRMKEKFPELPTLKAGEHVEESPFGNP